MGKSLGITAFVLLLISLPIPIVGNYLSLLAVLILSFAAFQGEKQWVLVTDLIAWVKMFFLSPTWHLMMFGGGYARNVNRDLERSGAMDAGTRNLIEGSTNAMQEQNYTTLLVTVAILAAPLAIMFWKARQTAPAAETPDA